jgi:hypothetical protein
MTADFAIRLALRAGVASPEGAEGSITWVSREFNGNKSISAQSLYALDAIVFSI